LNTGDEFYLINNQKVVCKIDYQILKNKSIYINELFFLIFMLLIIEFDHINNRSHAIITQNQLKILKQAYNTSSNQHNMYQRAKTNRTELEPDDLGSVRVYGSSEF